MSELKVYHCNEWHNEYTEFYLKDEVDNVFRRLKARLARKGIGNQQLEADKNHNWRKYCTAMTEILHQKYKRCLDRVKWCDERIARYSLQQEIHGISWKKEIEFYRRLRSKYVELAEQFKEAK